MSQTDNDIAAQLAKENPAWIFKIEFAPTVEELQEECLEQDREAERRMWAEAEELEASETYLYEP